MTAHPSTTESNARNRDTYRRVNAFKTWRRPCSDCGSEAPRPKWQYRCDRCKVQYRQVSDAD